MRATGLGPLWMATIAFKAGVLRRDKKYTEGKVPARRTGGKRFNLLADVPRSQNLLRHKNSV
jgi:hypothetical protein